MTLRLAPVGQKKPYLYLSSWDSKPSNIYRRVQKRKGPAKGHKPSLNRAGQGPRALALLHTMVFALLGPPSGDSQPAETGKVCAPWSCGLGPQRTPSELVEPTEDLLGNQQQQPKMPRTLPRPAQRTYLQRPGASCLCGPRGGRAGHGLRPFRVPGPLWGWAHQNPTAPPHS